MAPPDTYPDSEADPRIPDRRRRSAGERNPCERRRHEKDQDHRTNLAGGRDPGPRRAERRRRLPPRWMGGTAFRPGGGRGHRRGHGEAFDLLLGRRTYDIWSDYWPKAENNLMADTLNAATKYVATHRPDSLRWGPVEDLGGDIVEGVRRIKAKDGPDLIVWGSSTPTPVLIEHGLADEVLLLVYPNPIRHRQTFLFGWSPAMRTRARRHEGCVLGHRHQHLQAQRAFADRLLRRRGGLSRRQGSCRREDEDHHRGLLTSRGAEDRDAAVAAFPFRSSLRNLGQVSHPIFSARGGRLWVKLAGNPAL
jgi:dihydrofolate reductase